MRWWFCFDVENNSVTFGVYDDHAGFVERSMPLDSFMDMINHVIMTDDGE